VIKDIARSDALSADVRIYGESCRVVGCESALRILRDGRYKMF